jgi:hypothetical protein
VLKFEFQIRQWQLEKLLLGFCRDCLGAVAPDVFEFDGSRAESGVSRLLCSDHGSEGYLARCSLEMAGGEILNGDFSCN